MASSKVQEKQEKTVSSTALRTPYIHWIHCNICYEQYMRKTRQFYLLACNHICCEVCVQNISQTTVNGPQIYKCGLCDKPTRACKLGNAMPPHLKELFHPEPYLDGLHVYRIMQFQDQHRKRFIGYIDREYNAIKEGEKEAIRIKEEAKKNYQLLDELKIERKQLENRVISIKHKRRELEEYRQSKRSNSSSGYSSHNTTPKKPAIASTLNINNNNSGITSFSHHTSNHSFVL